MEILGLHANQVSSVSVQNVLECLEQSWPPRHRPHGLEQHVPLPAIRHAGLAAPHNGFGTTSLRASLAGWKNARLCDEVTRRHQMLPVMERKVAMLEATLVRFDPFGTGVVSQNLVLAALREVGMVMSDAHIRRAFTAHTMKGSFNYLPFIAALRRELSDPTFAGSAWEKPRTPLRTSPRGSPRALVLGSPRALVLSGPGLSMRLPPLDDASRKQMIRAQPYMQPVTKRSAEMEALSQAINERFYPFQMYRAFKVREHSASTQLTAVWLCSGEHATTRVCAALRRWTWTTLAGCTSRSSSACSRCARCPRRPLCSSSSSKSSTPTATASCAPSCDL